MSMATAGRAITFSGLTVAIGLSAMLFYQGTFLASMGAGGLPGTMYGNPTIASDDDIFSAEKKYGRH